MNANGTMNETIDSTGNAQRQMNHGLERVEEIVGSAKDRLRTGGKRIADTARDAAGATDQYVHSSPWQAVGMAAMVGAAMALLLARR